MPLCQRRNTFSITKKKKKKNNNKKEQEKQVGKVFVLACQLRLKYFKVTFPISFSFLFLNIREIKKQKKNQGNLWSILILTISSKSFQITKKIRNNINTKILLKSTFFFFFWLHRIYLIILQIEQETDVHIEVQVSFYT